MDLLNIHVVLNFTEELEEELIIRAPKRYVRDMQNPFEYWTTMWNLRGDID